MKKQMKKNKKGFTLVEMIVVIAIIGVLAAMMVPSLLGYIEKANISNNRAAAATIGRAAATLAAENNIVSASLVSTTANDNVTKLNSMLEGSVKGTYKVKIASNKIQVTYAPKGVATLPEPGSTTASTREVGVYPEN